MEIKVQIIKFEFFGETIESYFLGGGLYLVPIQDMIDSLKLDFSTQARRILRDPVLSHSRHILRINGSCGENGEKRLCEVACLDLRKLPYFIGGIDLIHIQDENKRGKVIAFQEHFADVTWAAFRSNMISDPDMLSEMDMYEPGNKRDYYKMMDEASALRRMIQDIEGTVGSLKGISREIRQVQGNQIDLESLIDEVASRLRVMDARLSVYTPISAVEILAIRKMVQRFGEALMDKNHMPGKTERYWHGEVYKMLDLRFKVETYHNLKASDFEAAVEYLKDLWKEYFGSEPPDSFSCWQLPILE